MSLFNDIDIRRQSLTSILKKYFKLHMGMKTGPKLIILFLVALYTGSAAVALELYSVVQTKCNRTTGLIIDVNDSDIFLLNTLGHIETIQKQGVEHILVYNTLDNPITHLHLDGDLASYLRYVSVQGDEETNFVGWPIRFMEELIVFFDVKGNIHLVNTDMIQGFSIPEKPDRSEFEMSQFQTYQFGFGNNLPECGSNPGDKDNVIQPTRMISDPISKVGQDVILNMRDETCSFERRTS